MAELGRILPLDEGEQFYHARIISLEKLVDHDSLWRLRCELGRVNRTKLTYDIQLDSALDWNVLRYTRRLADNTEETVKFEFTELFGNTIATKQIWTWPDGKRSEHVVSRSSKKGFMRDSWSSSVFLIG